VLTLPRTACKVMGMTEMQIAKVTTEIKRAYETYTTQHGNPGGWMSISEIFNRADLTMEQVTEGIRHLSRHEGFIAVPESNQKALTVEQRACAVWIGGQHKHLLGRV
jgi:hypothetical protein